MFASEVVSEGQGICLGFGKREQKSSNPNLSRPFCKEGGKERGGVFVLEVVSEG